MEEDALLEWGEWIDVLDVGGASWDTAYDVLDVLWVELHQGEHLGGDGLGLGRDEVGRDLEVSERIGRQGGGELGERGAFEDPAHFSGQPEAAQPLQHLHDEQGVAAELEEVVVSADAFE